MNKKNISIAALILNVVLLAVVVVSLYARNAVDARNEYEAARLRDSLATYKAIAEANLFLLNDDTTSALKIFRDLERTTLIGHEWTSRAIEQLKKDESFRYTLGSMKNRENVLQGNIHQYRDSVNALFANNEAALTEVERLNQKIDDLSTDLELTNVMNRELMTELKKAKSAFGQLTFVNAQGKSIRYYGSLEDGMANGFGIAIVDEKGIYEGYWNENQRHGKGKYKWANGDTYDGEFHHDKKDGFGIYTFASGERYEGEWKNDLREGKGVIHTKEGKVMAEGRWKNDKFVKNPSDES